MAALLTCLRLAITVALIVRYSWPPLPAIILMAALLTDLTLAIAMTLIVRYS
jgi:hypothetical protein